VHTGWSASWWLVEEGRGKWLSVKNRSPRVSTPRHLTTMSSTAKPPDPMPCALAALLLPECRAHGGHTRKTMFLGAALCACEGVRARAVPALGVHSCGVRGQREPGQRHGCEGVVPGAAVGRRALVGSCSLSGARVGAVGGWACRGLGDAVSSRCAGSGTRAHLGWCGVRWLFQGCCPGGRLRHLAPF